MIYELSSFKGALSARFQLIAELQEWPSHFRKSNFVMTEIFMQVSVPCSINFCA